MKTRILATLILSCCVLRAAAKDTADYTFYVQDFRKLTVVDGINVDYYARTDSAGWAVFSCPPEMASRLMFSNNAEHLTVQTSADDIPYTGIPRLRVYSSTLESAINTGDSTLRVMQLPEVDKIKIQEMGNGRVEAYGLQAREVEASVDTGCGSVVVTGQARKGRLRNVGTGIVDATNLSLEEARIFVMGSGPVYCNVADKISVYGIGPGKIFTDRMPAKVSQRSLGVKVELLQTPDSIAGRPE